MNTKDYDQILDPKLPKLSSERLRITNRSTQATVEQVLGKPHLHEESRRAAKMTSTHKRYNSSSVIAEIDLTKIGESPILQEQSYQKLNELRKTYDDVFHSQLYIAIKGSPQLYKKNLQGLLSERYLKTQKALEEVEVGDDFVKNDEITKIQMLQNRTSQPQQNPFLNARNQLKDLIKPRKEVLDVMEWIDKQVKSININTDITQLYKQKQTIFAAGIAELIRQIQLDCKERGIIVRLLWDCQIEMSNHLIQYLYRMMNKQEHSSLQQVQKTHRVYQSNLEQMHAHVKALQIDLSDKNDQLEKSVKESRYLRKKDKKMEKQLKDYIKQIKQMQTDHKKLIEENIKLTMAQFNVDWQTAFEMKRNLFEIPQTQIVTVKELNSQVQTELQNKELINKQNEAELNQMISRYMSQIKQNDYEDDQADKFDLDSLLIDATTDCHGLINFQNALIGTDEIFPKKNRFIQTTPDVQTESTQTGNYTANKEVNTNIVTYATIAVQSENQPTQQVVFRDRIIYKENKEMNQSVTSIQTSIQQPPTQAQTPVNTPGMTRQQSIKNIEEENDEDKTSINFGENNDAVDEVINTKYLQKFRSTNQELQELINQQAPTSVLREKIRRTSAIFDEFVGQLRENIQLIENDKEQLRSEVYSSQIALENNSQRLNDHRRMIQVLQRDMQDLQEVAVDVAQQGVQPQQLNESIETLSTQQLRSRRTFSQHVNPQIISQITISNPNPIVKAGQRTSLRTVYQQLKASANQEAKKNVMIQQHLNIEERKQPTIPVQGNPFSKLTKSQAKGKSLNFDNACFLFLEAFSKINVFRLPKNRGQIIQNIQKILGILVTELLKLNKKNEPFLNPFHVIIYDHFVHKFGLKNVAERNYYQLIQNIYALREETDYLGFFAKLMFPPQLLESNGEFKDFTLLYQEGHRVQLFITALAHLDESGQKNTMIFDRMFTTLYRVKDTKTKWIGNFLQEKQVNDMVIDMEEKGMQQMQQTSLFHIIGKLLDLSDKSLNEAQNQLEILLLTICPHTNYPIGSSSFLLFFRNLERSEWIGHPLVHQFERQMDTYDDLLQEQAMSYGQFVQYCNQNSIFQTLNLNNQSKDTFPSLTRVRGIAQKWAQNAKSFKWTLFSQKQYSNAHKRLFDRLDTLLNQYEGLQGQELTKMCKVICFAYDLLQNDLKFFEREQQLNKLIQNEYLIIQNSYAKLSMPKLI